MLQVRVQLIDPSADVLPYDHALAAALARRGLDVELLTSRFVHGPAQALCLPGRRAHRVDAVERQRALGGLLDQRDRPGSRCYGGI